MKAPTETIQSHLRSEVDNAGKHFEQTVEKVIALTGRQPGPDLWDAAQLLTEDLRLYTGALRRMANYAAHA